MYPDFCKPSSRPLTRRGVRAGALGNRLEIDLEKAFRQKNARNQEHVWR
jgi:hypothetical protein